MSASGASSSEDSAGKRSIKEKLDKKAEKINHMEQVPKETMFSPIAKMAAQGDLNREIRSLLTEIEKGDKVHKEWIDANKKQIESWRVHPRVEPDVKDRIAAIQERAIGERVTVEVLTERYNHLMKSSWGSKGKLAKELNELRWVEPGQFNVSSFTSKFNTKGNTKENRMVAVALMTKVATNKEAWEFFGLKRQPSSIDEIKAAIRSKLDTNEHNAFTNATDDRSSGMFNSYSKTNMLEKEYFHRAQAEFRAKPDPEPKTKPKGPRQ